MAKPPLPQADDFPLDPERNRQHDLPQQKKPPPRISSESLRRYYPSLYERWKAYELDGDDDD